MIYYTILKPFCRYIRNTIFESKTAFSAIDLALKNHIKNGKISVIGNEGEYPGKDPVPEKWRLVQATSVEAGTYLYLLSRKEESFSRVQAVEPSRDCCVNA